MPNLRHDRRHARRYAALEARLADIDRYQAEAEYWVNRAAQESNHIGAAGRLLLADKAARDAALARAEADNIERNLATLR